MISVLLSCPACRKAAESPPKAKERAVATPALLASVLTILSIGLLLLKDYTVSVEILIGVHVMIIDPF
jgi:hypothetical protein